MLCSILGSMRDAREDVCDDAEVVHSLRMVVLCAIQELEGDGVSISLGERDVGRVVLKQRRALG